MCETWDEDTGEETIRDDKDLESMMRKIMNDDDDDDDDEL